MKWDQIVEIWAKFKGITSSPRKKRKDEKHHGEVISAMTSSTPVRDEQQDVKFTEAGSQRSGFSQHISC
jgi:hypothetical protein